MEYNIKDFEEAVTKFNNIMGVPDNEKKSFEIQYRVIKEELEELKDAENSLDRIDAVVDILVTSLGLITRAEKFGYDVYGAMKAVMDNNMTKFISADCPQADTIIAYSEHFYKTEKGKNVKAVYNEEYDVYVLIDQDTGKVNKPIGYTPPALDEFVPKEKDNV